jgi:hypothetical protein
MSFTLRIQVRSATAYGCFVQRIPMRKNTQYLFWTPLYQGYLIGKRAPIAQFKALLKFC